MNRFVNRFVSSIMTGALLLAGQGCYKTVVRSEAPMAGPLHEKGQWFSLAGLVALSRPAGKECPHGLSFAESEMGGTDILFNIAVSAVGIALGAGACRSEGASGETIDILCVNSFATIAPLLLSRRTVRYGCAAAPMEYMPGTPQGTMPAPVPPAPATTPAAPVPPAPTPPVPAPPAPATPPAPAPPAPGTDPGPAQ
jgi:hypothetical protein